MRRLLEPLVPSGSILEADTGRNLLILGGTERELRTIVDNIELFDVDWLAGMSFALYSPRAVDARTLAKELGLVISGPLAGMVRLVPIERLNAVLAISQQPKYLDDIRDWVERLDRPRNVAERQLYVYRVQHGRAKDLASVLTKALASEAVEPARATPAPDQSPTR